MTKMNMFMAIAIVAILLAVPAVDAYQILPEWKIINPIKW